MELREFYARVSAGDPVSVRRALEHDPSLARRSWTAEDGGAWEPGATALHAAVRAGRSDLVELLLDGGADPEARTRTERESRTPLHDSYEFGQEEITRLLLQRGARQDLCVAAARGDFECAARLLEEEPELVGDESSGLTPLGWAGYGRDPAMVAWLIGRGAVLRDEIGAPCQTGRVELLRAFLDAGASADGLLESWGGRPLHVCATLRYSSDSVPAAELLLEHGADVNGAAADGRTTPLDVALRTLERDPRRELGARRLISFLEAHGARCGS